MSTLVTWAAMLALALPLAVVPVSAATTPDVLYPADSGVVDVKARYGAIGDGRADDTAALQKALDENVGGFRIIYLPAGTYRITRGLTFGGDIAKAKQTVIQGQHRDKTTIRLADRAEGFGDPGSPRIALSFYDGESSGQAFANALCDVTIDTGSGNTGAIALLFLAHNQGTLRDVRLRSGDGAGVRGLDLTRRWPGPFFVQRVEISGFDVGVEIGHYDYSLSFEDLALAGQRVVGLRNGENKIAIHRLTSTNRVPAIEQTGEGGYVHLLDASLDGGAKDASAIRNRGRLVLRRVATTGYGRALDDPAVAGTKIASLDSAGIKGLWDEGGKPLDLPIKDAPAIPAEDPAKWVAVDGDDSAAIQSAIDRAAEQKRGTVYLKPGRYDIGATIRIHGSVRRIAGLLAQLNAVEPLAHSQDAGFVIENSDAPALVIERCWTTPWDRGLPFTWIENRSTSTTLVLRNLLFNGRPYRTGPGGAGPLFIEDVCGAGFAFGKGQQVWARQINPENLNPLITCDGATAWLFNLKTEGLQTVIRAAGGSKVEMFGGYIFPIHPGAPQFPAFELTDSQAYLSYNEGNIGGSGSAYQVHVVETRKGVTRELKREQTDRLGDGTRMTSFSTVGK